MSVSDSDSNETMLLHVINFLVIWLKFVRTGGTTKNL
jgi:hypothetical protein